MIYTLMFRSHQPIHYVTKASGKKNLHYIHFSPLVQKTRSKLTNIVKSIISCNHTNDIDLVMRSGSREMFSFSLYCATQCALSSGVVAHLVQPADSCLIFSHVCRILVQKETSIDRHLLPGLSDRELLLQIVEPR